MSSSKRSRVSRRIERLVSPSHRIGRSTLRTVCAGILLVACQREAATPVVIDARPQTAAAAQSPPPATTPAAPIGAPVPAAAAPSPEGGAASEPVPAAVAPFVDPLGAATVELSGVVVLQPGTSPTGRAYVFVSRGDCLDPGAQPLRRMPVTDDGAFMMHTLASPGTELSICAHMEGPAARGAVPLSSLYGQATARVRVEKSADLVVHDLQIALRPGPPRRFAVPAAQVRKLEAAP